MTTVIKAVGELYTHRSMQKFPPYNAWEANISSREMTGCFHTGIMLQMFGLVDLGKFLSGSIEREGGHGNYRWL